jgi:integrase/recombinase XerD
VDVIELIKKEGFRRGLSQRTIVTYCNCVKQFLKQTDKEIKRINKKDIKEYLFKIREDGACGNTLNVYLNALKFLLQEILGKFVVLNIKYSKRPKTLPVFLTKEEIKRLINSIENPRHKLMIEIMYSAGLRLSELVHLKVQDLEITKNYGWVRHGKGDKDRLFIIAERLKEKLKRHIKEENLEYYSYMFKGRKNHISQRSVQEIVKKAAKKANIKKNVHPHTLRHSFATHLIENDYSVYDVQPILGHASSETTMTYVHMANPKMINIKSPYDALKQD